MSENHVVAELRGITVTFPGVRALDGVDLVLRAGEIHSLMGENGAGKSTLIKALTGVNRIDEGTIVVDGRERTFGGTGDAQLAGIATVYQEVNLCPNLSVGENVMLGHEVRGPLGISWRATHAAAAEHLGRLSLDVDPRSPLSSHSIAVQQLIAICRAIVLDSRVLVLDEPTSSLDQSEVQRLFGVMRRLRGDGVAILFVSHFLDQVYEVSDRLTVLRNGELVGEYLPAELDRHQLISRMLGRDLQQLDALTARTSQEPVAREGPPALRAVTLGRRGVLEPVDVDVHPGEVVGIAGLLGSGRTELARLLYGADRADSGTVEVLGEPARITTPRSAIAHGIAFSSEDRRSEGIVGDLTVRENVVLGMQARRGWAHRIPRQQQDEVVARFVAALGIRPADPETRIRNLSGGNQQKVLLARWLAMAPKLIILDEPTRGIDVGAKADVQKLVADLASDGLAVVFISSELEEVVRLAHRIHVLRDRRRIAVLDNEEDVTVDDLVAVIAQEPVAS